MNKKQDIKVYIDGDYWNYYEGYAVYPGVDWMMPREYYKDRDDNVYNYAPEWSSSWKDRNGHNLRFDMDRKIQNERSLDNVMKEVGERYSDWTTTSYPENTEEPVGVHIDYDHPHFSTAEEKKAYYDKMASELSRFD